MKRFVNGVETELEPTGLEVVSLGDRVAVRTSEGTYTGVAVRVGDKTIVSYRGNIYEIEKATRQTKGSRGAHSGEIHAPMPGLVVDVLATEGVEVEKGDKLVVVEAMKTQQPFGAPFDGTVQTVSVKAGDQVSEGQVLVIVSPRDGE